MDEDEEDVDVDDSADSDVSDADNKCDWGVFFPYSWSQAISDQQ